MTLNFFLRSFTLIQIHKYEGQTYCSSALGIDAMAKAAASADAAVVDDSVFVKLALFELVEIEVIVSKLKYSFSWSVLGGGGIIISFQKRVRWQDEIRWENDCSQKKELCFTVFSIIWKMKKLLQYKSNVYKNKKWLKVAFAE